MVEERQSTETQSPWWGEHLFRYQWAEQYVRPPMKVLDLACGTGFGSALLSRAVESDRDRRRLGSSLTGGGRRGVRH